MAGLRIQGLELNVCGVPRFYGWRVSGTGVRLLAVQGLGFRIGGCIGPGVCLSLESRI